MRVFGIEELTEALTPIVGSADQDLPLDVAFHIHAALKSAVRAVTPGRQQKTNLDPMVKAAQKAFIRTLRRRVK